MDNQLIIVNCSSLITNHIIPFVLISITKINACRLFHVQYICTRIPSVWIVFKTILLKNEGSLRHVDEAGEIRSQYFNMNTGINSSASFFSPFWFPNRVSLSSQVPRWSKRQVGPLMARLSIQYTNNEFDVSERLECTLKNDWKEAGIEDPAFK